MLFVHELDQVDDGVCVIIDEMGKPIVSHVPL